MTGNQSLNHLLNFTLPPRQSQVQSLPRRSRRTGTQQGVWNKERFLNAQYRFLMNPGGDYTVHFADPDIYFQWQDILQIIVPRTSAAASTSGNGTVLSHDQGLQTCPICLSPPTAPRMTKCGHVYCYPCILHLVNTSDKGWVRCPICFDSINEKQLKSVKWYDGPPHIDEDLEQAPAESSSVGSNTDLTAFPTGWPGSTIRMRLMQRPQITTLALPRSSTWPSELLPPHQAPFHFLPDVYTYSKFMLATPAYLIQDLTKDLDDLATERRTLVGMRDELSVTFVDAAAEKVRLQIAKASALETPMLRDTVDKAHRDQSEIEARVSRATQRKVEEQAQADEQDTVEVPHEFLATQSTGYPNSPHPATPSSAINTKSSPANAASGRNSRQRRNVNPPPPSTQTYYFYQSASGLPIFLHPLDIKILFSHFHSYSSFPDTISVRVEAFSEGSVNDDLRKRCKYLAYMPEGADVVFVEANLEDVVGVEGLRSFEGALKSRRARRKEKERKDDKAKVRAEERERERLISSGLRNNEWAGFAPAVVPSLIEVDRAETPVEEVSISEPAIQQPQVPGAWGARSFASAAHAGASGRAVPGPTQRGGAQRQHVDDEEWDAAWHDLESRSTGRKKKSRLIVLGGGGGSRRR
ncbi:hypothetical protein NEOLEDRAFT_1126631 [Neolentinus lepideus HHB14362 ss-1]|uniref:RING-type domain-containing protein n=1 Tax=Neolentinus lepideus HHB14362 ss-1 TaxID=1314782 RepID=A0A165WBH1_9AGAM|nr:hypothetical protein NEOLEDRAFT_1126631 [Neolentinus lepideus HHB14362 ss-1]